ncbi:MAG: hypothetical protein AAFY02_00535 [Pseudomonadota bacterium]
MWFKIGLAIAAATALAACTSFVPGTPVIGPSNIERYTAQSNALFVGNGQLVLLGDPEKPDDRLALAEVAAENIAKGAFGATFQLTPRELADKASRNRVIVVVGGAYGWTLCEAPPVRGSNFSGQGIRVTAAACNGNTRLSSVSGSIGGLNGVDDPALANFFAQIGAALFPGRNLDYQLRDRGWDF